MRARPRKCVAHHLRRSRVRLDGSRALGCLHYAMNNPKWTKDTPAECWYLAALLKSKIDDATSVGWSEDESHDGSLELWIGCNDYFCPGSDCEVVPADSAILNDLLIRVHGLRHWQQITPAVVQWIAYRRGYSDARSWKEKMKEGTP